MDIINKQSPFHNEKRALFLIIHSMAFPVEQALNVLEGRSDHEVSCHYAICPEGKIYRFVDESRRAWHAGKSYWHGVEDVNSTSIGIELINPDPDKRFDRQPFAEKQIHALQDLAGDIMNRHQIQPRFVLAHQDIAPDRKPDPGKMFPWKQCADKGIGLWHGLESYEDIPLKEAEHDNFWLKVKEFGYDTRRLSDEKKEFLLKALRTHYAPQLCEKNSSLIMKGDDDILSALLEQV